MNSPSDTSKPLRKVAMIRSRPGQSAELHRALQVLEDATRKEAGCREFVFYQALSSPDDFLLVEEFISAAALEAHMNLPHTAVFFQAKLTESIKVENLS